nr:hypothetical protein [uncultured Celeribacter sp.]
MQNSSSVGDDCQFEDLVRVADNHVRRLLVALDEATHGIAVGDPDAAQEVSRHLAHLSKALNHAFDERRRLDELRRQTGDLGAGELDLDDARSEIFDRLDRLRTARGAGGVSG